MPPARISVSIRSWSGHKSSMQSSQSCREISIRSNRQWYRFACFVPAIPTMSFRRRSSCAGPHEAVAGRTRSPGEAAAYRRREPAAAYGAKAKLTYRRGYPVLVNHERQAEFAASVASQVAGQDKVDTSLAPMMGAEDFSYMLNARPGAFIWIGNGDSAGLHHPAYNFNDDAIPSGRLIG